MTGKPYLIIFGYGRHCHQLLELFELTDYKIFVSNGVDNPSDCAFTARLMEEVPGQPLYYLLGIGPANKRSINRRSEIIVSMEQLSVGALPPLVEKTAYVMRSACLDEGAICQAHSFVGSSCRIGRHSLISTNATVEHDTTVGENSHVAPGAVVCGGSEIGDSVLLGARCVVLPGAKVPSGMVVKAGEVYG